MPKIKAIYVNPPCQYPARGGAQLRWGPAGVRYEPGADGVGRMHDFTPFAWRVVGWAAAWSRFCLAMSVRLQEVEVRMRLRAQQHRQAAAASVRKS